MYLCIVMHTHTGRATPTHPIAQGDQGAVTVNFYFYWLCKRPRIFKFWVLLRFWSGDFFSSGVVFDYRSSSQVKSKNIVFGHIKNQTRTKKISKIISALRPGGLPGSGGFAN
jgi:hypothetical protein